MADNPTPGAAEIEAAPELAIGAIENGRAFAGRLLQHYEFKDELGHELLCCMDWHEFMRCFDALADNATHLHATIAILTARAEAAEAEIRDAAAILDQRELAQSISRDGGKTFEPWPFVKRIEIVAMAACDEDDARRAEALAARVAELEAALRDMVGAYLLLDDAFGSEPKGAALERARAALAPKQEQ